VITTTEIPVMRLLVTVFIDPPFQHTGVMGSKVPFNICVSVSSQTDSAARASGCKATVRLEVFPAFPPFMCMRWTVRWSTLLLCCRTSPTVSDSSSEMSSITS
jgi:hypothetical protein